MLKYSTKYYQTVYIKKIIHHDQIKFIPRIQVWYKIYKSINVIHDINWRIKIYDHINGCRKNIDKIQHLLMIKTFCKVGIKGTYLNVIKAIYDQPTASIILNGQKLQAFPLRSGTRQECLLSPLIQHSTGSRSYSNQTKRRNKRHPNWKGRSKTVFLCRCHDNARREPMMS